MPRLIDADVAKKNIDEWLDCVGTALIGKGLSYTWELKGCIDEAPTIDPESLRPHGRWVEDGDFIICLNCESEINIKNSLGVENKKDYCPNCGAKMYLEEQDDA